ncbi:MAG: hypothetical protein LC689_12045 [Myxococcales bacterium]|nr:hypothetical protein [Myxococcales bacterium]
MKEDVASHFRKIAEETPTVREAVKKKAEEILKQVMSLFYDGFVLEQAQLYVKEKPAEGEAEGKEKGAGGEAKGAEAAGGKDEEEGPVEIEIKPFEYTTKPDGSEGKMGICLKDRNGGELKAELIIFENNAKEGLSGPHFSGGLEQEFKIKEDIPIGHGITWTTPALKFELGGSLSPEWTELAKAFAEKLEEWVAELIEGGCGAEIAAGLAVVAIVVCEIIAIGEDENVQRQIQADALRKRKENLKPNMINGYKYGITEGSTTVPEGAGAAFRAGFEMGVARRDKRPPVHLTDEQSQKINQVLAADKKFEHVACALAFKEFYDWLSDQPLAQKNSTILNVAFLNAFGYEHAADPTPDDRKLYKEVTHTAY